MTMTQVSLSIMNKLCDGLDLLPQDEKNDLILRAYRESPKTVNKRKSAEKEQVTIRQQRSVSTAYKVCYIFHCILNILIKFY